MCLLSIRYRACLPAPIEVPLPAAYLDLRLEACHLDDLQGTALSLWRLSAHNA
jgi:hypothetical protein